MMHVTHIGCYYENTRYTAYLSYHIHSVNFMKMIKIKQNKLLFTYVQHGCLLLALTSEQTGDAFLQVLPCSLQGYMYNVSRPA